uniref:Golgin subfamily A member 7 n=1 Tax=Buteo japonicus TaxID=224669 RepID=A0A8C0BTC6_9AVES
LALSIHSLTALFNLADLSGCELSFPPPLSPPLPIDRQQFEETVRTLNNLYAEAEKLGGQSYLEGCLACLTAYTIFLCMETHYEKVLKKIAKFIQEQNEKIYAPQGLLLTDPIERGLRVVSFMVSYICLLVCPPMMCYLFISVSGSGEDFVI